MKSEKYWREREEKYIRQAMKKDKDMDKEIAERFNRAMENIRKEIADDFARYAVKENITLSDAFQRADALDVKVFAKKAKEYVKNKDFSEQANAELRLYNLTMRVNRLELLKAKIGLELIDLGYNIDERFRQSLTEQALAEYERQAGILGESILNGYKDTAKAIVNGSFSVSDFPTFSENIWQQQAVLKSELDKLLTVAITQGYNPKKWAGELKKIFGVTTYQAQRLARTESARVQTEVQKDSYEKAEIEDYEFIAEPTACETCLALDSKVFKVKDMVYGKNAAPMHPNCRCSSAPSVVEVGKQPYNAKGGQFINELKDYKLSRDKAIVKLKDEFGMSVSETSRTKLSETALNQTYGVLKAFENIYNALPEKIPLVRALTKSKAKNAIAWYSRSGVSNTPIEFGINVGYFNGDEALQKLVNTNIKIGWFSKNADPNHIMVHEFGHHIDFQLSKLYGSRFADAVLTRMAKDYGDNYDLRTIAKTTGGYASSYYGRTGQHSETFAELFSEAYGDTPRDIAKDFKTEFEKMAKELIDNANKT